VTAMMSPCGLDDKARDSLGVRNDDHVLHRELVVGQVIHYALSLRVVS